MPETPEFFADIHCHPSFKPYGQSFKAANARPDPQPGDKVSLWYPSKITAADKKLSKTFGVAMYHKVILQRRRWERYK